MAAELARATDKSYTLVVVSSLKDVAGLLRAHEAVFVRKVARVIIQGGVTVPPTAPAPGSDGAVLPVPLPAGTFLEPDTAHNNEFDRSSAAFFHRR